MTPIPPNTGATDINGRPITEGDFVMAYNRIPSKEEWIGESDGGVPIYQVSFKDAKADTDNPPFCGTVQWDTCGLRWEIKVERHFTGWMSISHALGDDTMSFEVIDKSRRAEFLPTVELGLHD